MIAAIKNWFARSETILWARIQVVIGVVWAVLIVTDLSPLLSPKVLTLWLIFSGIVTEIARRRGTVTVEKVTPDGEPAKVLVPAEPLAPSG